MENVVYDNETNIIDYANAKAALAKATPAVDQRDESKPFDLDALLAEYGLHRASVDAMFAAMVTNEKKEAPDVAQTMWMLKAHRELLVGVREMAAMAQAELDGFIKAERGLEDELILEKFKHLQRVASHILSRKVVASLQLAGSLPR
jgi:hypothetical protein